MKKIFELYVGCFKCFIIFKYAIFKTCLILSICSLKACVHTCSETQILDIMFSNFVWNVVVNLCMWVCSMNSTYGILKE